MHHIHLSAPIHTVMTHHQGQFGPQCEGYFTRQATIIDPLTSGRPLALATLSHAERYLLLRRALFSNVA